MKKYNVIILAGGKNEQWCEQYGQKKRALLPLLGKPMLDWVIEVFHKSEHIDNIIVVGPKELDQLKSMHYVRKRLPDGKTFIQNLLYGIFYLKAIVYKFANEHTGYLISFCDAVFLTTEAIDDALMNITNHDPGAALHYIQKETIAKGGYPAEDRSYLTASQKDYTGSNIFYIKKITKLLGALKDIRMIRKYRKDPNGILKNLDCYNVDVATIEQRLSKRLSTKVKIFITPYPEMGVDVDKPADYELAKRKFAEINKTYAKITS